MKNSYISSPKPSRPIQGLSQREITFGTILFGFLYTIILFLVFAAFTYFGGQIIKEVIQLELSTGQGEFRTVVEESGLTEFVGYLRTEGAGTRFTLPLNETIRNFTAYFIGGVPEIGTEIFVVSL